MPKAESRMPLHRRSLPLARQMPDLRSVLANRTITRERAHASDVQHRSARPAFLLSEIALRTLVRLDVGTEIGEMEVAVAIDHRFVHPAEEAKLGWRETI